MKRESSLRRSKDSAIETGATQWESTLEQQGLLDENFRTLFENTSVAFTLADANENIVSWNKFAELLLGMGRDDLYMKPVKSLYPQAEWRKIRAQHVRQKGTQHHLESRMVRGDGEVIDVDLSLSVLKGPDGSVTGSIGIIADMTERKREQEQLRAIEDNYKALFENSAVAITVADGNECIVSWNKFAETLLAMDASDLHMKPVSSLYPEEEWKKIRALNVRQKGTHYRFPTKIFGKDRESIGVDLSLSVLKGPDGTVAGSIGIILDHTESRKATEALRAEEEHFRVLIENSMDAISILNADGTVRYESPSAERILGYKPDEMIGKGILELIHPDDVRSVMESLDETIYDAVSHPVTLTVRFLHKDGSWRTVEGIGNNLLDDPKVNGIVVNYRDITERRQAEEALRESEDRLRDLFDNASDMIQSVSSSGEYIYVNRKWFETLGYSEEEVKSLTLFDILRADQVPHCTELLERIRGGEMIQSIETVFMTKDGREVHVEGNVNGRFRDGTFVATRGIFRDVTERKQAEEALQESEMRLKALVDHAPDSITVYDLQGNILDCNRKGEEMLGYSREEMVGKNMFEVGVLPEDYAPKAKRALERKSEGMERLPFEFDLIRKDGVRITIEATTITVERGSDLEVICISRDVTERKKAEEEKRRMAQQLQLTDRLAAVGELAAGVAHELNNPLCAVRAYAEFLKSRQGLDEAARNDAETIHKEALRASAITGNLLSFASRHQPNRSMISINEAIEKGLELCKPGLEANSIQVVTQLDPHIPRTMADFFQMEQVVFNIISNAEHAMAEAHGKGRLSLRTQTTDTTIQMTISDNGPGISEENLDRIFDPFFTTKEVGQGTGLGLSICFGIVQEHGGNIHAKSVLGEGTTVVVELPIISEGHPLAQGSESTVPCSDI